MHWGYVDQQESPCFPLHIQIMHGVEDDLDYGRKVFCIVPSVQQHTEIRHQTKTLTTGTYPQSLIPIQMTVAEPLRLWEVDNRVGGAYLPTPCRVRPR